MCGEKIVNLFGYNFRIKSRYVVEGDNLIPFVNDIYDCYLNENTVKLMQLAGNIFIIYYRNRDVLYLMEALNYE